MRVHCIGARLIGGQIDRIEDGFRQIGWEVTPYPDDCDLCYVNDASGYDQAIADKRRGVIRGKLILTVLDLAPHLGAAFPLARIKEQLGHADAVTTISQTVARDIKARLGIDATVIYNPIRNVGYQRPLPADIKHPYRFLFVGRVGDPGKRSLLAASALAILGYGWDDMVTVGRETPPYGGVYWGATNDSALSDLYNSVDYLMCPTLHAFLGLPILEAMACGTIPVVCRDLDIRDEFLPPALFPEYDGVEPTAPSIARFVARLVQNDDIRQDLAARLHQHYIAQWSERLSPKGVAQAITSVYETLCRQ